MITTFLMIFCGGLCAPISDSHTEYSLCGSSAVGGDY